MKKILISLGVVVVVAAGVVAGTNALFNDTETSTGNILTAGTLDLKVDHLKQTYNGVDCNTCDLTLISDPSNMVVAKNGTPLEPYSAVYVGSNPPYFIHSAWTAQNDPTLAAAGAKWIWESDPTKMEDTTQDVTYTFEKKFEWYGPIVSSDLWFAIGSDNSIKVWLNGTLIAENNMERGYREEFMLHIPASAVNDHIVQGENTLTFEVKNWAYAGGPFVNPAGLIYKFYISGNCEDSYFKQHCQLWGETDLTTETFFNFDDVKPGDFGTNLISLHVNTNDAWSCLKVNNKSDIENGLTNPEIRLSDAGEPGELSKYIEVFLWDDANADGIYQVSETQLFEGSLENSETEMTVADSTIGTPIIGSTTKYVGLAWCAGKIHGDSGTGVISCNGAAVSNEAQTDKFSADLVAYAEQWRNNSGFTCVEPEAPPITGEEICGDNEDNDGDGQVDENCDLFFSEYVEGTSFNKALEIYNPTNSAVDLTGYKIEKYTNGSSIASNIISLTSNSLTSSDVYVVCNPSFSNTALCDQSSSSLDFNGNDAIVLKNSIGEILDVIGQIGFDPGLEWGTGYTSTKDNTIIRQCSVTSGDTYGGDVFDPVVEWSGFAIDTFSNLGWHTQICP